jgi:hypothetical protein
MLCTAPIDCSNSSTMAGVKLPITCDHSSSSDKAAGAHQVRIASMQKVLDEGIYMHAQTVSVFKLSNCTYMTKLCHTALAWSSEA